MLVSTGVRKGRASGAAFCLFLLVVATEHLGKMKTGSCYALGLGLVGMA